ncbi:MAG: hypothetical protein ACLFUW_09985, partial [Bacteroidales bacterium]
ACRIPESRCIALEVQEYCPAWQDVLGGVPVRIRPSAPFFIVNSVSYKFQYTLKGCPEVVHLVGY